MRLKRFALLVTVASTAICGCTAGRSASSPAASDRGAFSAGSEYDVDPPMQQNRSRMAIQPNPVPPAQGVSYIRGVSFSKVWGDKHTDCAVEPGCEAPGDTCCVEDQVCEQPTCGGKHHFRLPKLYCPSWLKRNQHKNDCCVESNCTAPQSVECTPEEPCGEGFFSRSRCWKRLFCPSPEAECVSPGCVEESYCQPLVQAPCANEGCSGQSGCNCKRFMTGLIGKFKKFPFCHRRPACGETCVVLHSQGCSDEGCSVGGAVQSHSGDACRTPSPLADPLDDPFIEPREVESPPDFVPEKPAEAELVPEHQDATPIPQPVQPTNPAPLNPVPTVPNEQVMVEPQVWPKLKVESTPSQQWSSNTHPTGWRRY